MKTGGWWKLSSLALVAVVAGCGPKLTMEDLKQMKPQRPAELDRLNAFAGTWTGEGTGEFMGMAEPVKVTGTSKTEWDGDKWYLVEHAQYTMADMEPSKSIGIWAYDSSHNKFRTTMVDSMGGMGSGTVKYSERKNMWTMKARGSGPMGSTRGYGTIRFLDDNTMEWSWREYAAWDVFHIFKIVQMHGTSKRQ